MRRKKKKRTSLDIIYDILTLVKKKPNIKKTHLMYKSNLSHKRLEEYLEKLFSTGALTKQSGKYVITENGKKIIEEYKRMKEFVESFGLE